MESLKEEIMELFRGLMNGTIDYSFDNMHSAMKTDICEIFNDIAEDFVMNIMLGQEITKEQLQTLHDNLVTFGEEFEVKEATSLAKNVEAMIE